MPTERDTLERVAEFLLRDGPATTKEIAQEIGATEGAVHSVLHRHKGTRFAQVGYRRRGANAPGRPELTWAVYGYAKLDPARAVKDAALCRQFMARMKELEDTHDEESHEWFAACNSLTQVAPLLAAHVELLLADRAAKESGEKDADRERRRAEARVAADCRE